MNSCVLCGAKLGTKEALQEHFRKHANKEIDSKGNARKLPTLAAPAAATAATAADDDVARVDVKVPESGEVIGQQSVKCDVCPMLFDTVTLAIQHKFKKHPEISAKHFCPHCGMQFPLKFTRDKHAESHKSVPGASSLPCTECPAIFYNPQALDYHVKSTHKMIMSMLKPVLTPPPSKKIKINNAKEAQSVYYCYLCGVEYIIKFNLQKHLEKSHTDHERNQMPEDLIRCTTCDALFYNKRAYDNHNTYHRPDDLYVTSEEQRLQTVSRVDQDFDIRRVQLVADKFIPLDKPRIRRRRQPLKETRSSESPRKSTSDDELSPTSSVDSSDSDNETIQTNTCLTEDRTASNSDERQATPPKQTHISALPM